MTISNWRRRAVVLGALASMAVAAAGCGGGDDGGKTSCGRQGGTFSVGAIEPDHLHPGRSGLAFDVVHALFSPLLKVDRHGKLVEVAAEWVTSKDQRTWTIAIKPGWTFHDGAPVTTRSYVDAWSAVAYGPNAWENNGQLANIEGYDALNPKRGKPRTRRLSGLEVVDDTTFRVTLKRPDSQFPLQLSAGTLAFLPLPEQAIEDPKAYDQAPIGNGPYTMDGRWRHNQRISVKRYPGYKGPKPNADRIDFRIYTDLKPAYRDVQAGNLDIVNIGQDQYAKAKRDFGERLLTYDAPAMDFLLFSPTDERLRDPRIRQAFALAIDRVAISKALFGGVLPAATSLTSAAYRGGGTMPCDYCRFDPARAKRLLGEAGGFTGTLTIGYPAGSGYDSTFQAIGNQLRTNLGIADVKLDAKPFAEFVELINAKKLKGVYRGHWGSFYPSLKEPLNALFMPGGFGQMATAYESDEVNRLVAAGDAADDADAAIAKYREAEARVIADVALAPLFGARYVYVHSRSVSNVIIDVNQIELADVRVER